MFDPIDPTQLPDELELPLAVGYPPLVPVVPYAPAIDAPRSVEAARADGLLAWLAKRDPRGDDAPEGLLPIGAICQVGDRFGDDRTALHAVARCTWHGIEQDGAHPTVRVRPVAAGPSWLPLATFRPWSPPTTASRHCSARPCGTWGGAGRRPASRQTWTPAWTPSSARWLATTGRSHPR